MSLRLVALDEGPDIALERAMVIVGRHPQCDARLDSIRISRRHCCMTPEGSELIVRDLGSTNGIRVNGQRVEEGRLRVGDELSIAHIRFRLDSGIGEERTMAATLGAGGAQGWNLDARVRPNGFGVSDQPIQKPLTTDPSPLVAIQEIMPAEAVVPSHLEIQVHRKNRGPEPVGAASHSHSPAEPCPPDSPP